MIFMVMMLYVFRVCIYLDLLRMIVCICGWDVLRGRNVLSGFGGFDMRCVEWVLVVFLFWVEFMVVNECCNRVVGGWL